MCACVFHRPESNKDTFIREMEFNKDLQAIQISSQHTILSGAKLRRIGVDNRDGVFNRGEVLGAIPTLNMVDYTAASKESGELLDKPLSRFLVRGIEPDGQINLNAKTR